MTVVEARTKEAVLGIARTIVGGAEAWPCRSLVKLGDFGRLDGLRIASI